MIVTHRFVAAAMLAVGVGLSGCHREAPPSGADSAAIRRAQDQLSQPAWLRAHLPPTTVGYLRQASPGTCWRTSAG